MIEFSLTISSVFSASLHRLTQTTSQDTLLQSTGKVTLVMQKSFRLPLHVSVPLGSLPITSIYSVVSLNSALLETSGCSLARLVSFASAKSNSWRALGEKKKNPKPLWCSTAEYIWIFYFTTDSLYWNTTTEQGKKSQHEINSSRLLSSSTALVWIMSLLLRFEAFNQRPSFRLLPEWCFINYFYMVFSWGRIILIKGKSLFHKQNSSAEHATTCSWLLYAGSQELSR